MVNLGLKCALEYLGCSFTDLNVISLAFISFIDFNKEIPHSFSGKKKKYIYIYYSCEVRGIYQYLSE